MNRTDDKVPLIQFDNMTTADANRAAAERRKPCRGTIGARVSGHVLRGAPAVAFVEQTHWANLALRLQKFERQRRWLKYGLLIMAPLVIYIFVGQVFTELLVQRESQLAVDRMQLFDVKGNIRVDMRVFSGVPIMQLMDERGIPRLSLGLRYDDSPFISLSDVTGQTRASFQMGEDGHPALRLFDENGETSFSAN